MKKIIILCFCCIMCGCVSLHGSFKNGTMDMDRFVQDFQKVKETNRWKYGVLQDTSLTKAKIEDLYHIPMVHVEKAYVYQGVIPLQCTELALFKIESKYKQELIDGIEKRKKDIEESYPNVDINDILNQSQQGMIGQYYYFILGDDARKVVNYIRGKK